jgi:hypothetical protein
VEHPLPHEVEVPPPVHLAPNQLQFGDLPFDLSLTPLQATGRFHRLVVLPQSFRELNQFSHADALRRLQPRLEIVMVSRSKDPSKALQQCDTLLDLGVKCIELANGRFVLSGAPLRRDQQRAEHVWELYRDVCGSSGPAYPPSS